MIQQRPCRRVYGCLASAGAPVLVGSHDTHRESPVGIGWDRLVGSGGRSADMPVPLRAFLALRDLALAKHKGSPAPRAALQQPPEACLSRQPVCPSSSAPRLAGTGARSDAAARRSDQPAAPRAPALQTGRPPARPIAARGRATCRIRAAPATRGPPARRGGRERGKEGARD